MVVRLDPDDPLHSSRDLYDSTTSFISSLGGFLNPELPELVRSDDDDLELQVLSRSTAGEEEPEDAAQAESFQAAASASLSA